MKAPTLKFNCEVERCRLKTFSKFRGGKLEIVNQEYRIEPCGIPLFKDVEQSTGVCGSCASGWTRPDNAPTPAGEELIKAAIPYWQPKFQLRAVFPRLRRGV